MANAIRKEVQKIDKDLPVTDIAKMPDLIDATLSIVAVALVALAVVAGYVPMRRAMSVDPMVALRHE